MFASARIPLLRAYAESLATDGVVRGLIGPREVPRLWDRHLLNCGALAGLMPEGSSVADIGSGAGLPGLVLAIARPDLTLTLIEPLLRRTVYLQEIADQLGLDNVTVIRGRAESVHGKERFDVVTSRAVAPLERLLTWSMPLVAAEGALIALKGSAITEEIEEARSVLSAFGCAEPEVVPVGEGLIPEPTLAVRVCWADPSRAGRLMKVESQSGRRKANGAAARRRQRRP
ncbi:16S rRNA (guanine(527)-N(7))-methyltransferase RsmG [Nocardioides sp. WY-20]|uniref:Ribosomal RNA small subunit methyltransferase G n=1 Tax=Nocardioides jiangxiensis TaxID=3064524 RepID=A0ABT9B083_9ACTN|nr:16S rRNA (guanine(527)-N(7))-methyltransferase RsmG [Nocardioides sp. WY-20]MDO7868251.1 16S rRNA (guanine(527)-N(7))-methyltransferase RsmG [Nocardioides sp. WY-20]